VVGLNRILAKKILPLMTQKSTDQTILVQQQRDFFRAEKTQSINFRLEQLGKLKQAIVQYQEAILQASNADLGRPSYEAYFEIAAILEVNNAIKNLKIWAKPKRVKSPIDQFPASAWIQPQPLGVVLIISPWNYPFQLAISPLIGAIAAGNCAIIKPSEQSANTSKVIADMIGSIFDPSYIAVAEGGADTSQGLLAEKFDHIFFTGGTEIGKIVMAAAAKHLTPVTLELGGKCPCIVDNEIHLDHTAKRIAWGKWYNAGQTCIAPDYLVAHHQIKDDLIHRIKHYTREFYGEDPAQSPDYGRIINSHHFDRLTRFLNKEEIILGGDCNADERYIAPTLINANWEEPLMQEEIFGPILPILAYEDLGSVIAKINDKAKPLALYFFSSNEQKQKRVINTTSSGGACINDVMMQGGVDTLPFGGVGESGMGSYHGKASFDTFSHFKSVLNRKFWLDLDWRYAPYTSKKIEQLKKIVFK
jgi:aldehyde dehydrogenase (NAD+)